MLYQHVAGHSKPVAFSQSRVLPTAKQYIAAFKAFRARFPWVKEFATWDETNYYGEATYDKEALVASYYRGMRSACPSCRSWRPSSSTCRPSEAVPMTTWATAFDKALGYQPGYWGFNNYEDANHLVDTSTRALLRAVTGKIWLAETGGIVRRYGVTNPGFPQNAAHAAIVDRYVLTKLAMLSPRIQRIYLYEWDAHSVEGRLGHGARLVHGRGARELRRRRRRFSMDGGFAPTARSRSSRRRARDSGPEA